MSGETYQAIFDAVRSKLTGGDIGQVVADIAREKLDISFAVDQIKQEFVIAAMSMAAPSAIYRPVLTQDGDRWLAIYGTLPTGVVGTGETPAKAMADFDVAWHKAAVAPPPRPKAYQTQCPHSLTGFHVWGRHGVCRNCGQLPKVQEFNRT